MSRAPGTDPSDAEAFVARPGAAETLDQLAERVASWIAARLDTPAALLRRDAGTWQFAAEAWPAGIGRPAAPGPATTITELRGTGVALGRTVTDARWMLVLPGAPAGWDVAGAVNQLAPSLGALLDDVAEREEIADWKRFARRYHVFCRRLTRAQDEEELHDLILRTFAAQVRAEVGVLATYSEPDAALAIAATLGYPREIVDHLRIVPGDGVLGEVFRSKKPSLANAPHADAQRRLRYRTDSYIALPLVADDRVLAVVAFTDRRGKAPFSAADLSALRLLASPAALALSAYRFRRAADEGTRLASIDPLTGLYNRRHFDTRLEQELQRARRHNEPLTLLMIDIDNFKTINDEQGHVAGDRLLRCIADRLRRGVRIFDVCARYGGDEFAILMPSSSVETAVLVAERIRTSVRNHCAQGTMKVTVSIGIAVSDGREPDLLSLADRALLEAKAVGKNALRVQRGDS